MKFKLFIALLLFQLGFSQQRTCATNSYMQQMINNPIAKQKHLELQQKFEVELSKFENQKYKLGAKINSTIYIPVAVHFPNVATNSTDKACLRQLSQNQIDILNADFNATNSDINLWTPTVSSLYPGTNVGVFDVRFVLATQNHPLGTGLLNGNVAVTFGTNFLAGADQDSQWSGYMNIVVRVAGALGYSPLGGSPNDGSTVVINYDAFGSGTGCAGYIPLGDYNLGRTLSHELGHFFNLDHTFGNSLCNAANTDDISDTPQCLASGGCPPIGSVAGCVTSEKSLTMNYMDYTDDACMYMFTAGQANRMRAYYNTIESQFSTNLLSERDFKFKNFSLYPNPNNGNFKISFEPETNDNINIEILNISGRNIYNKTVQNSGTFDQEINLEKLQTGIYLISIQNGENRIVKRIVLE
jgi:Secretion system C-terminal sorting domain/Pregnancy-associated plasma protein-A